MTVIDTGVISLNFLNDPRVKPYFDEIEEGRSTGYTTSITLTEYYYKTCQKLGREVADLRFYVLCSSNLRVVSDYDLSRRAGYEKCRGLFDLSTADCYLLALAKRERGLLLTTDGGLAKIKEIAVKHFPV